MEKNDIFFRDEMDHVLEKAVKFKLHSWQLAALKETSKHRFVSICKGLSCGAGAIKQAVKSFNEFEEALAKMPKPNFKEIKREHGRLEARILYGQHSVSIPDMRGLILGVPIFDECPKTWPPKKSKQTITLKQFIKRALK